MESSIRRRHRLASRFREIDNCQSAVAQQDGCWQAFPGLANSCVVRDNKFGESFSVGSAMDHVIHSTPDLVSIRFEITDVDGAHDSAHLGSCHSLATVTPAIENHVRGGRFRFPAANVVGTG